MMEMLKSFALAAVRSISSHLFFSLVNIAGLAIGMCGCLCMLAFFSYQLSFDRQFPATKGCYSVFQKTVGKGFSFGNRSHFSQDDLEWLGQQNEVDIAFTLSKRGRTVGDRVKFNQDVHQTSEHFFDLFDVSFHEGSPETVFINPYSVVITKAIAKRLYGDELALGRTLTISTRDADKQEHRLYSITGVLDDLPHNSQLKNFKLQIITNDLVKNASVVATYIKPRGKINASALAKRFADHINNKRKESKRNRDSVVQIVPIQGAHLIRNDGGVFETWVFIGVGFALSLGVLLISCFNFINLSCARFSLRLQEISLRKTLGADRPAIFLQFLTEAFCLVLVGMVLSQLLLRVMLSWFGGIVGAPQLVDFNFYGWEYTAGVVVLMIIVTILSGGYPALQLSRLPPLTTMSHSTNILNRRLQDVLVALQVGAVLVVVSFLAVQFTVVANVEKETRKVNRENMVMFSFQDFVDSFYVNQKGNKDELFRQLRVDFESHPAVSSVSTMLLHRSQIKVKSASGGNVRLSAMNSLSNVLEHYQISLLAGTGFDFDRYGREMVTEDNRGGHIVLTRSGLEKLGLSPGQAVQKEVEEIDGRFRHFTVIGVADAFSPITDSAFGGVDAFLVADSGQHKGGFSISINAGQHSEAVAHIRRIWLQAFGKVPEIVPLDSYDLFLSGPRALLKIFTPFAVLGVSLATLGLYALSTFNAQRRAKEVGIRKVLGASRARVVALLLWSFSKPLIVSIVLGSQVAYLLARDSLSRFLIPVPVELICFLIVPVCTLLLAWLVMFAQTYKAASTNPVDVMRDE